MRERKEGKKDELGAKQTVSLCDHWTVILTGNCSKLDQREITKPWKCICVSHTFSFSHNLATSEELVGRFLVKLVGRV